MLPVTTPELGDIETLEMVGGLLFTVADALADVDAPYPSVVDAIQVSVPPIGAVFGESVMLLPEPMVLPFIVHV